MAVVLFLNTSLFAITNIIYDQRPADPNKGGVHCHDYNGTGGQREQIILADDWLQDADLTSYNVVKDVHWFGYVENNVPHTQCAGFHLSIHNQDPQPPCVPIDPAIWEKEVPMANITVTDTGIVNGIGEKLYQYDYYLDSSEWITLTDGNKYWFDVSANSVDLNNPFLWKWAEVSTVQNCAAAQKIVDGPPDPWTVLGNGEHDTDFAFVITSDDAPQQEGDMDFGDAPEGSNAIAYPSLGVAGQFPTCKTIGPATWIQHTNFGAFFGPMVDFELDGNAGFCPSATCFPPYDQDECFQDGDAGLMFPDSFTIDNALNVVTCSAAGGSSLGSTCATAVWGVDIDIDVTNNMPNDANGFVNVVADWDRSGNWGGIATGACNAPEYILDDFLVPNGYSGPLSALMAAGASFTIGPNAGYVWVRFSITETEVTPGLPPADWDGSGSFEDGETEDYLLKVDPSPDPEVLIKFQQLPLSGLTIDQFTYWGHDELSTAYNSTDLNTTFEGCYMADDFADLKDTPVIKLKWWGSYIENEIIEPVNRFLIAFESDNPAQGHPDDVDYIPSHPGDVLHSEIVQLSTALPLNPGDYSETWLNSGGPPCHEALFEYEAVLENPFPQEPNVVYWLKIVAIIDDAAAWSRLNSAVQNSGMSLCDFLELPYTSGDPNQIEFGLQTPVTRWGWHNRDYTKMDPYASKGSDLPQGPGEHNPKSYLPNLTSITGVDDDNVWHFQDDAVFGDVVINENGDEMPAVNQDPTTWEEEYYKYSLPYCNTSQGVDGPDEIVQYSKDLAFELWTPTKCVKSTAPFHGTWVLFGSPDCWCYQRNCRGDSNGLGGGLGPNKKWVNVDDLTIFAGAYNKIVANLQGVVVNGVPGICADNNRAGGGLGGNKKWVNVDDLTEFAIYYNQVVASVPVCDQTNYNFWSN
jgi:hypothetical protein